MLAVAGTAIWWAHQDERRAILTRVQLYEHSGRGLPEMLDIRKSAGAPGTPPSASS